MSDSDIINLENGNVVYLPKEARLERIAAYCGMGLPPGFLYCVNSKKTGIEAERAETRRQDIQQEMNRVKDLNRNLIAAIEAAVKNYRDNQILKFG